MKVQLTLLAICIYLCAATAVDLDSIHEIRGEVEELIKGTEELNHGLQKVKDVQKGIEEKFKHQRDEIELIAGLEVAIAKLESNVQSSIQATTSGVGNLTAIVNAIQGQNENSIRNPTKVELEIRRALGQVAANQNKYEQNLNEVASSVNSHLAEIQQLLSQAVIGELIGLDNKAKVLQDQQRNIVGQSESLNSIEHTVHGVQVATSQVDHKLAALLNNQKNIERSLDGCKHKNQPHQKPHKIWTHPEHAQIYKPKPEGNQGYESGYASQEEAESLYQLWYGKGQ
ncbi:GM17353 [Drosophila sechellia]|uniref:GM17353 n=1 Tax=Drosophila sechellia TaxID=7238 RepID=B4I5W0_DROSE|nr:GM17353 [Drosophila sechellia]